MEKILSGAERRIVCSFIKACLPYLLLLVKCCFVYLGWSGDVQSIDGPTRARHFTAGSRQRAVRLWHSPVHISPIPHNLQHHVFSALFSSLLLHKTDTYILLAVVQLILELPKRRPEQLIQLLPLLFRPLTQLPFLEFHQRSETTFEEYVGRALVAGLLGHHGL
jgi:hypothetical protein